jgi:hypothetical protein
MTHIDVNTDAVVLAGNNTSGTSDDWASWAQQAKNAFSDAAADVKDATVGDAIEAYGSNMSGDLSSLANDVDALGRDTASAGNVVTNSDADSTAMLNQQGNANAAFASNLHRPI